MFSHDSELTKATRIALRLLVDHEEWRCGKRLVAYENIADEIGMSSSWLQKFLRDSGEVSAPSFTERIQTAYEKLCLRIEQENRADERRLHALKGRIDALAARANAQDHPENSALDMRKAST